jgi:hypothetical protein
LQHFLEELVFETQRKGQQLMFANPSTKVDGSSCRVLDVEFMPATVAGMS